MKRFITFTGYDYSGPYGAEAIIGDHDTYDAAVADAEDNRGTAFRQWDWWHVLDTETGEIAASGSR
jgi:hypothetical protein